MRFCKLSSQYLEHIMRKLLILTFVVISIFTVTCANAAFLNDLLNETLVVDFETPNDFDPQARNGYSIYRVIGFTLASDNTSRNNFYQGFNWERLGMLKTDEIKESDRNRGYYNVASDSFLGYNDNGRELTIDRNEDIFQFLGGDFLPANYYNATLVFTATAYDFSTVTDPMDFSNLISTTLTANYVFSYDPVSEESYGKTNIVAENLVWSDANGNVYTGDSYFDLAFTELSFVLDSVSEQIVSTSDNKSQVAFDNLEFNVRGKGNGEPFKFNNTVTTPEPATLAMLGIGLGGLFCCYRRKRS